MTTLTRRELGLLGGALALAGGTGQAGAQSSAAPAGPPPAPSGSLSGADQLKYVHPELREMRARQMQGMGRPGASGAGNAMREAMARTSEFLDKPSVVERMVSGPKGAPEVHVYIINSVPGGAPKPVVLHMHGGGMTGGDAKTGVRNLQQRCIEIDCTVVTVDYRLAPGTRFPGSLEDNYSVLKWIHNNAAELNVDRTRIAVIGESAGGGHAAMLAIAARDRGEIPVLFQALMYPMLDDRWGSTRPLPSHIGRGFSSGWAALLGLPAGSDTMPHGVPGRLTDFRGLPSTFIGLGSIDPTVMESLEYARRLVEVGILTEVCIVPGAYHAFNAFDSSLARQLNGAYYGSLARAFKYRA